MRIHYDPDKSARLRSDPRRRIGFEEAQELLARPHYLDVRDDSLGQWRAIGWVNGRLITLIYEEREDTEGPWIHLVSLWPSSREERLLYEKNA